ncbi:Oxygen-dependent choline dehydrogenase [Pseudogemmobacter humi]|uniref:Oxygen-dependent choline dehydrogenase n=2 Tax=Pseudogemmobacter humi TaxID=2483812 RepID=A0A3P5WI98_9RHOB|nr:Oxygen-dependent choline dehydrogenase [Pseudogemmobacter humi]
METTFDYVVIGAGSAGCAVAGRLSEDGKHSVLLLEAGGSDRHLYIQMPAASYLKAIGNPRFDWRYKAEADPTRHGRRDYMPRGKVVGGTSSINGMIYLRGQPEDFQEWSELGCTGWEYGDVLPVYKRAEDNENGADDMHGAGGPLTVSNLRIRHELSDSWIAAGMSLGLPHRTDFNRRDQEGIGQLQATQRSGRRCSAGKAYIHPAMKRRNFTLRTGAHVRRILFDGKRASGVEFQTGNKCQTVQGRRAIVLSGGALSSPQILMLSGIGPAAQLKAHGIGVQADLPGVGANFHDHAGTAHIAYVNRPTYNVQNSLLHMMAFGAMWLFAGRGPGTTPDAHALAFVRSRPELTRPDIQYHFTPAGFDLTEDGPVLFDRPAVTALCNLHRPFSRGSIGLKSSDPMDQPAIQPNLFSDERDIETLVLGAKRLRDFFTTAPLSRHVVEEFKPGREVQSDDEWRDFVLREAIGVYHPAGSCKMGTDPMAVVDARLRVHGISGLYVADASIMPTIVSGNLNASCVMIGERCADFVKQDTNQGNSR